MFTNKQLNWILIGLAILCVAFFCWTFYSLTRIPQIPEAKQHTDHQVKELQEELERLIATFDEIERKTKTEVKIIREKTIKKIGVLPPDDVARGLNDELAEFRGMGVRSIRMDDS